MIAATAVAAFAALPAMAEDGDKIVVGVSTDTATTVFRQVELMGLYDMAEENGDMEIIELNADNDTTTQATQFKSLIDQGVDVIVCCGRWLGTYHFPDGWFSGRPERNCQTRGL